MVRPWFLAGFWRLSSSAPALGTRRKVPLLGDLPLLGRLFKSESRTSNKKELLIFVTPKILREGV